jgi:hypothetical protein
MKPAEQVEKAMTASLIALREFLDSIESGPVADTSLLEGLLANCWDDLSQSSAAGMEAYELHHRMEHVRWQPPILFFVIERHGGTVLGSTRAELRFALLRNLMKNETGACARRRLALLTNELWPEQQSLAI